MEVRCSGERWKPLNADINIGVGEKLEEMDQAGPWEPIRTQKEEELNKEGYRE
jgi:hypothetical protein